MTKNAASDAGYSDFVTLNWSRYLRVALLLTGSADRAEELLQDSLVQLYRHWRRVVARGDPHVYSPASMVTATPADQGLGAERLPSRVTCPPPSCRAAMRMSVSRERQFRSPDRRRLQPAYCVRHDRCSAVGRPCRRAC